MSSFTNVVVSDPKKCSDRFGTSYISYKITANNERGELFSSVRRFSDFHWLSQQLARNCPGAIVPAIPDKKIMGRHDSDFVESRRRALERFLQRLSIHSELGRNESFVLFLTTDEQTLKSAMDASKSPASKRLSMASSWLSDTANQLANSGKVD